MARQRRGFRYLVRPALTVSDSYSTASDNDDDISKVPRVHESFPEDILVKGGGYVVCISIVAALMLATANEPLRACTRDKLFVYHYIVLRIHGEMKAKRILLSR